MVTRLANVGSMTIDLAVDLGRLTLGALTLGVRPTVPEKPLPASGPASDDRTGSPSGGGSRADRAGQDARGARQVQAGADSFGTRFGPGIGSRHPSEDKSGPANYREARTGGGTGRLGLGLCQRGSARHRIRAS